MVQFTSFPEGWPGQSDAILAVAIFALVVWQVFGEGAEVRRRQDYLHLTSGERESERVSFFRALLDHVRAPANLLDILLLLVTAVFVALAFLAAAAPRPTVPPPAASSDLAANVQQWWKLATWDRSFSRPDPDDSLAHLGDNSFPPNLPHTVFGTILLLTPFRLMFAMRWHFGVSSILNTILFGGTPLIDMLWAMFSLLLSFSLGLGVLFGVFAGHASYAGVATSLTETALMAFGFLDYADVTSQGHGGTHDGLGLGGATFFGPLVFWALFLLLQIIATNILIAVTGDGYEQHVDDAERQTGSDGKSFVKLAWRVARLRLFYQPSSSIRQRQEEDAVSGTARPRRGRRGRGRCTSRATLGWARSSTRCGCPRVWRGSSICSPRRPSTRWQERIRRFGRMRRLPPISTRQTRRPTRRSATTPWRTRRSRSGSRRARTR